MLVVAYICGRKASREEHVKEEEAREKGAREKGAKTAVVFVNYGKSPPRCKGDGRV